MCIHQGMYNSAAFKLRAIPPRSTIIPGNKRNGRGRKRNGSKECLRLCLTESLHIRRRGHVYRGTLTFPNQHSAGDSDENWDVVAKLGTRRALQREANIYDHLTRAGVDGIRMFLGLFQNMGGDVAVLVTENCGISVDRLPTASSQGVRYVLSLFLPLTSF
jgi:hypothetical protein